MQHKVTGITTTVHLNQLRDKKNTKLAYLPVPNKEDESAPQQFPTQEKWSYLLATEVVKCWREREQEKPPSLEELLGFILDHSFLFDHLSQGETDQYNLFVELEDRANKSVYINSSDLNYLADLERINQDLKNWYTSKLTTKGYTGCRVRLTQNARNLKIQTQENYQKSVNLLLAQLSPQSCLDYLQKVKIVLSRLAQQDRESQENYDRDKSQGLKSYQYLLKQIEQSPDNFLVRDSFEGAKNLLHHIYQSTLNSDIQIQSITLIKYLIGLNQIYLDNVTKTCHFLTKVQRNLALKSNNSNLLPFLFERFLDHSSPSLLRQEIENQLGYSLYRWGISPVSPQEVQDLLLQKLNPLVLKIYMEFRQEILADSYNAAINQ